MTLKNKRYFWIQLTQDFFKSKEMKLLRKIAGGDTHTIIYLKMMLISLEDGGRIYYDGLADNLAEELSLVIDENIEDIKITLIFLESKGLLTKKSDRDYFLEQVPEMVGSETASARRVRKFRENKLALQCNTDETKRNGDIDKEIDIDTDKEVINTNISCNLEVEKNGCQMVAERLPQVSIGKVSIDKNNKNNISCNENSEVEVLDQKEMWFESFWEIYPKHQDKKKAKQKFLKACTNEKEYKAIMDGLRNVLPIWAKKDTKYIPMPTTWLNGERWNDEVNVNLYELPF